MIKSCKATDSGTMITAVDPFGKEAFIIVNIPYIDFSEMYKNWQDGMLIQESFPDLTSDEREFMISGITNWDELYGKSD